MGLGSRQEQEARPPVLGTGGVRLRRSSVGRGNIVVVPGGRRWLDAYDSRLIQDAWLSLMARGPGRVAPACRFRWFAPFYLSHPRLRAAFALGLNLAVHRAVRRSGSKPPRVMVVADNQRTLNDLRAYFERVGVESNATRNINAALPVPSAVGALVVFPDGYATEVVEGLVLTAREARSALFILLVTSAPQDFARCTQPDGRTVTPVVLARPAFGWTIVDAIRAAARSEKG